MRHAIFPPLFAPQGAILPQATAFLALALLTLLAIGECHAQGRATGGGAAGGGFGTGASLGSSQLGGGATGGSSFGGASFGQSSMSGTSFGQSSFGSTGTTTGATGQNGTGGFIGRGAADLEAFFGGINQQAQSAQRQQRAGRNSQASSSTAGRRPEVRVTLSASPELTRRTAMIRPTASAAVSTVSRLLARKGVEGVSVSAAEGVATLEGYVASESDRLLAEKLAAIEPGVARVDNRLQVLPEAEVVPPGER